MTEVKICPKCGSNKVNLRGIRHTKRHGDKQRFSCQDCHSVFYEPKTVLVCVDASKFDAMARPFPSGRQE